LTPIPLEDVVRNLNASLRGWVGYFHYRNSSKVLDKVKTHAENRLRNHLMKRHKIRNREEALKRFPRQKLYADYGLFKVPVTAGWKSVHAVV
jgi:RNA-directed DNA polymerase